jgi:agmatinase
LGSESRFHDLGDLVLCNRIEDFHAIESAAAEIACRGSRLLAMGGDHSITYPLLRALAAKHPGLGLLQVDAHPDIRDEQDGNRYSHASPFARILEEGLISRLVQVGIRFLSPPNLRQIERFGSEVIPMVDWPPPNLPAFDGPFYLSLDLDGLDPAFAPGVTHREPGGLATREVLQLIHRTPGQLVGADIVEYNPERDVDGITAVVAAKLVKEVAARLLHHHH